MSRNENKKCWIEYNKFMDSQRERTDYMPAPWFIWELAFKAGIACALDDIGVVTNKKVPRASK